ncbi:hypothetical protein [Streptomyces sp. NPDC023838]|uniref:hypothetical protein n=1 Tax=Streptomyces sp. NPDC023838 TaxID=3154325 RepID=UPI0033C1DC41
MARIRMLTGVSGDGFVWEPGQVVDLPGPEAAVWADGRRAVMVREEPPETPEAAAPEKARRAPARPRGGGRTTRARQGGRDGAADAG